MQNGVNGQSAQQRAFYEKIPIFVHEATNLITILVKNCVLKSRALSLRIKAIEAAEIKLQ
jgi:hypothetical protein